MDGAAPARKSSAAVAILKEAGLTAAVAFALALPLIGLRGFSRGGEMVVESRFEWLAVAVAVVFLGRVALILSRRALASDWVKREWTHARIAGRKVSPVLADPSIRRSDLPGWIRRAEVYDIAEPERWNNLVQVLNGPKHILETNI